MREQKGSGVPVALELHRDDHAGFDKSVVGLVPHLGAAEQGKKLANSTLDSRARSGAMRQLGQFGFQPIARTARQLGLTVPLLGGAAIYVAGLADSIDEGVERARESIDSGRAWEKLTAFVDFTRAATLAGSTDNLSA